VSLSPDGSLVYVTNNGSNTVSIIDAATNKVVSSVQVGKGPASFGNFVSAGTGCAGAPVTFTITITPSTPLTITSSGNLTPLSTIYGTPSTSESFQVTGTGLNAGILVTPPLGFEVSTDNTTFSGTVTIGSGGNISATAVYIRLAATTPAGNFSGPIVLTSAGATTVNVDMPESTVTPALLTIIADNKSKTFGSPNPVLTASYIGFVNSDAAADLTAQPELSTSATAVSPVGQYPIAVGGASSPNYTISYLSGVLTILPTEASLVIPNTFTPNGDGINDTWDIKFLGTYINCSVDVFTRWGQKIYSSLGYPVPWNGTYNGSALPTGTYYYIINLKNGLAPLSGFVAIIR
jgi:gliding motility-associated-like protein